MNNICKYKIVGTVTLLFLMRLTSSACSCSEKLTTEQEYKRSDLVIQGKIIGADTVYTTNTLSYNKRGIKVGRHKYSAEKSKFLRIKMIIEKNFKSPSNLPDTIYILTHSPDNDACDYPFPPYLGEGILPDTFYQFIVYGDKWIETTILTTKKGKRTIGEIKETLLPDTFFTSRCKRTQHSNEDELNRLTGINK